MITWQDAKTPDELMELIDVKGYKTVDKWYAFRYWANSTRPEEHQFFLELLNSPYFSPEEIFKRFGGQIDYFHNEESVDAIYEKLRKSYFEGSEEYKRKIEQTPYCWRIIKDVEHLCKIIDGYEGSTLSRWQVFKHYAMSSKKEDEQFFNLLLDSQFVTPEAIARSFNATNARLVWKNAQNLERARVYVENKLAQDFKENQSQEPKDKDKYSLNLNIASLEKTPNGRKKLKSHLEFFAEYNQENFNILVGEIPSYLIRDWYFSGEKTELGKKIEKIISANRPEIMLGIRVDNLKDQMDWDLVLRKQLRCGDVFDDWKFFEDLIKTPGAEKALYNFLLLDVISAKRITERYSKEQIEGFGEIVSKFVKEDSWKYFDDQWFIVRRINEENKWQVLDYYLENNYKIVNKLVKDYDIYSLGKMAAHFIGKDTTKLPEESKKMVERVIKKNEQITLRNQLKKEENLRKKHDAELQRLLKWCDKESGNLRMFFTLSGGRQINCLEEYLLLANEFINSGLTVNAFARKYKISSSEGLLKMLHLVASENEEFSKKFNAQMEKNQNYFYESTRKLVEALVLNKITVKEFIDNINPNYHSLESMVAFINSTYNNPKVVALFTHRIISYYYVRLNAYKGTTNIEDINNLMTKKEMLFILGNEKLVEMKILGKLELENVVYAPIKATEPLLKESFKARVNGFGRDKIRNRIKMHNELYRRKNFNGMIIGTINKGEIKVDDDTLEKMEAFAQEKDLFLSEVAATKILCAMAEGKITASVETKNQTSKNVGLDKAKTIKDYINIINQTEEQLEG